jgi:hypothetical protein
MVSGCYDSNGNTTGGSSLAAVQVVVHWADNPIGETINVTCTGASSQSIDPATAPNPSILTFTIPANGAAVTVEATFSTTTSCTATQNLTAPAGNCLLTPCQSGNTGGIVWSDMNSDGVKNIGELRGVSGISVKAYDCLGNLAETTSTDAQGQYQFTTLTPTATNKYRIEFSNLPAQYSPSLNGTNGRTDVQFIVAASCNVDFGIVNPNDYCQTDPQMAIACYALGDPADLPGPVPALVSDRFLTRNGNLAGGGNQPVHDFILANVQQIGSVYGLGYSKKTGRVYTAAFMKRLTAFGNGNGGVDGSTGAIYSMFPDGTGLSVLIDLPASETGTNPHPTTTTDFSRDPAWDEVGKIGWGDIEVSDDGMFLWAMNLFNRKLYKIDILTGSVVDSWYIPGITGGVSFQGCATTQVERDTDLRPFALKEKNGKVYVGVTCTGESTNMVGPFFGDKTALHGFVFEFDVLSNVFNSVPVLDFPMSNPPSVTVSEYYQAWKPDFNYSGLGYNIRDPRPLLVDIDFVGEDMLVGIRNRTKDMFPALDGTFGPDGTTPINGSGGGGYGRVLKASKNNFGWTIENSTAFPSQSLGFNFYEQDVQHNEGDFLGSMIHNPATGEIAAPATVGSDAGGVGFIQPTTHTWKAIPNNIYNTVFLTFQGGPVAPLLFGKANGLGEPLFICNNAPLEIGNYVWIDADNDGVQDPCEMPLSNITVALWKGSTQIASTTTNSIGEYYFSNKNAPGVTWLGIGADTTLLPLTPYELRISMAQSGINTPNYSVTTAHSTSNNGNDQNDSDASLMSGAAVIGFTTGAVGSVNHTYDFGFAQCTQPSAIALTKTLANCSEGISQNDGIITIVSATNADYWGISTLNASTYDGNDYASASPYAANTEVINNVPNVGGAYILRIFNGANNCYRDTVVVFYPLECAACEKNVLYICGSNKPNDADAFDHGLIDYFRATGHTVTPGQATFGDLVNAETGTPINTISNYDKIVVSHSAYWQITGNSDFILDSLVATPADILYLSTAGISQMGFATSEGGINPGGTIWIEDNTSPILPSGLSNGSLSIMNDPTIVGLDGYPKVIIWGSGLGSGAIIGSYVGDQPDTRATYFGYPKGATLSHGNPAPGRRFFLGVLMDGASIYLPKIDVTDPNNFFTADGKKMLDAALENTCLCCVVPSGMMINQTAATCTGATTNNNGVISLIAGTEGTHFGVSSIGALAYDGPMYASASAITLPQILQTNVPNTGGTYILRVFNGSNDCFLDMSVTVTPVTCCSVPNCGTATLLKN